MKYIVYILGIAILTFGISFTIRSDIGTSPFDALLVGLSMRIGLTVGSWEIILAVILITCNALLTKQKPEIVGLLTAFITGIFIDIWLFIMDSFLTPELWYSKGVCFTIGLVLIGLGTAIYLHTNIAPIPVDRLTLIIQELTNTNMFFARTFIYLLFLILAVLLNGPIGIGTLLTVCLGGMVLQFFMPYTEKTLNHYIKSEDQQHSEKI
ncbi:YczE/YyaS/YitT family protein [Niallia taxi]|uniref:YitT family protein n=1 Tax=Niallia taxi TaxID=2499688 RepID=A0A437KHQ2_9BACI|nr:YitT family protein [Niallia taxi]MCM3216232.1 YitT family protein [Niallia taxi]MDK8643070.1 YitT family protein [Niallia taxi]MED4053056.1 YitT family protein [Niallia taxi]MED4118896.1 YitT family protein [Niallia taxi]RVT67773.1 YitT family protein [Niallia taxi]